MEVLLVKNMVCHRCVVSVEDILNKAAVPFHEVLFGEIHLTDEISREQMGNLTSNLKNEGFLQSGLLNLHLQLGLFDCFIKGNTRIL